MFVRIAGADDPRLAPFKLAADPDALEQAGLFVAESQLVLPVLLASRYETHAVLVSDAAVEPLTPLLSASPGIDVFVAPPGIVSTISGHVFHRGCVALGKRPTRAAGAAVPVAVDGMPLLLLERVSNPDNIGGIFRAALALGATAIVLGRGCGDPLYRKAIRTSMGATLQVAWQEVDDWTTTLARVREAGYTLAALTPAAGATPLDEAIADASAPLAFMLGSEGFGLSDETLAAATIRARIPMTGRADSLNVVTAAAIALYEAARARR